MTISTDDELEKLRAVGRVVARALEAMASAVRPGISPAELDTIAAGVFAAAGARSAPQSVYAFPAATCISVNDAVVHGIPDDRPLEDGDVVTLDVTAELDGFMADAARSVTVGRVDELRRNLVACARTAFERSLARATAGAMVKEIGHLVESEVRRQGFTVIRELAGHGIGRTIHEPPTVPNYADPRGRSRLREGTVLTIEPIIAAGDGRIRLDRDGWTIRTADASPAAHHEHTLVVTRDRPILLTAA